ncbi:MAG TPA: ATP-binding cassette domain-containing protein [Planctomycetes bacterium]|nr:ATP-binding cassette domain-containing protein [Planctomycetota bacterium]HIK61965.1 ATP-binding cassette domain-containing protein [Planctomycetota bacterium]
MPSDADTLIRLEGVHKSFGDQHILRGLSFDVRRGQCLGVMGGSGSGKSVTLRHVIGLLQPDAGRVVVDGQDMAQTSEADLAALRRRMGYVFQESALINWLTVAENLALPLEETTDLKPAEISDRVAHTLGLVHIPDAADKFPNEISGGMKKRVGLARALITQPEIVLYDEPNAGLDPRISRSINALIRELSDTLEVTSLVVEHRIDCLKAVADEVIFMHAGVALVREPIETFFDPDEPKLKEFLGV